MNKKINKPTESDFNNPYEFGFETDIDTIFAPKGLNEDVIRFISNNCLYKGVIERVNKLNPKGLKKNIRILF